MELHTRGHENAAASAAVLPRGVGFAVPINLTHLMKIESAHEQDYNHHISNLVRCSSHKPRYEGTFVFTLTRFFYYEFGAPHFAQFA